MMLEQRVSRALAELTEDLRPQPDPYRRVLARRRRGRRRTIAASVCALALLATTGTVVASLRPGGGAEPAAEPDSWVHMLGWADRLARSEPRGTVAADRGYVDALAERLLADQRAGRFERLTTPVREVRVLFVDDVGPYRIAFAAFVLTRPDSRGWPNARAWMVADRGAGVAELARTAPQWFGDGLEPYDSLSLGNPTEPDEFTYVGLAPGGCEFDSAPMPEPVRWRPEGTGSYLVRGPGSLRPEWFQISCAGEIRQRMPAPGSWAPDGVSDRQFSTATAGARGRVDPDASRTALNSVTGDWGYAVTEVPKVVWAGETTGTGIGFDGTATVLAAPAVGGGWLGEVRISHEPSTDGSIGTGIQFQTRTDPSAPDRLLAVPLASGGTEPPASTRPILVVAPAGATEVRAVLDGRPVAQGRVRDSGVVLVVPNPERVRVEALDSSGAVLGTAAEVAEPAAHSYGLEEWGRA